MALYKNQVIAISGAGSGIGFATAKCLYEQGARISLADLTEEMLRIAVTTISGGKDDPERILTCVTDVRMSTQVDEWVTKTVAHFGTLDGAVNAAGVVGKSLGLHTIAQLSNEEWSFVMDVNINGIFYALRAQTQALQKLGKGGSIVNISSVAGIQGNPKNAAYSASKHAVIGISRSAAKEFGEAGIRINVVAPGAVATNMTENIPDFMKPNVELMLKTQQAIHRYAEPEELARPIMFLLGGDSSYVTGSVFVVDGGNTC